MKATMTSKGQITIPASIRQKLGLETGTVLEFDEQADPLRATKAVDPARMRSVVGLLRKPLAGKSATAWLDHLRGPVKLPRKGR